MSIDPPLRRFEVTGTANYTLAFEWVIEAVDEADARRQAIELAEANSADAEPMEIDIARIITI